MSEANPAPAALAAFLQGIERRAWLLAWSQCGSAAAAERALAGALRAFRLQAADWPMAEWPRRFWALLAAAPMLRQPAPDARWSGPLLHLATVPAVARLALLLRLAAGLDEADAAAVLAVGAGDYRRLLAEACPRDAGGRPDAAAWRALAEAVQSRLRTLPPDRLAAIAGLRVAALTGVRPEPEIPAEPAPSPAPATTPASTGAGAAARRSARATRRRLPGWRSVAVAAGGVVVAVLLTVFWPSAPTPARAETGAGIGEDNPVTVEPLSGGGLPDTLPADPARSPDAAMLADPQGMAMAREADFDAWFAAGAPVPRADTEMPPPRAGGTDAVPETATGEDDDAAL